ncbi:MAG: trypsin-like peptidase domain-containing protein [Nitrosomonas sp.]|nr:trypsin-like peptidase domain-containing protein [Nitrosomonas sp.]MDP1951737.1 trypsin-like peptidase domain-containing protein [Nitrosomonas sp.]
MSINMLGRIIWFILIVAALTLLFRSALVPLFFTEAKESAVPRLVEARGNLAEDEESTIELFENSRDSVVFITTRQRVMDVWTRNTFSVPRGTGSGFIWDDDGHIVTNFHVIKGASEATVRLADGRDYKAVLVGASPAHDIAVLKVGIGLQRPRPVPLGTSHDLKVGQKVFAIGNPFGLDWTLTTGIVSALDRSLPGDDGRNIENLIQTDAAINPGSSGGPLLDSAGRLIGINTMIYSPTGASAGVSFSVPVDTVNRVVPQLISRGKYIRPGLGITVDSKLNERLIGMLNITGVVILGINPGSAAAAAGLKGATITPDGKVKPGDVIVALDNRPIITVDELLARLDKYKVGDVVQVTILREEKEITLPITLQPGV